MSFELFILWIKRATVTLIAQPNFKETGMSTNAIWGTTLFDGDQAQKGYALNKMCYSFNSAEHRAAFKANEEAYMQQYELNEQQANAIRTRNVLGLLAAGGNVYYLAKFAGILGLDVQDLGALQTGMTKEAFKAKLCAAANQ